MAPSTMRQNRPRPVFSMRIGASRSSRRRLRRMRRAVEVVAKAGQLEARVEPHFLVREVDSARGDVLLEQRPQDAARDAADEVIAVEEDAAVHREVAHERRPHPSPPLRPGGWRSPPPEPRARRDRSISIALATNDATTPSTDSSASSNSTERGLSTIEHPDELTERDRGHRQAALGVSQPRQRHVTPGTDVPLFLERALHRRRVLPHLAEVADADRRRARRRHSDRALPHRHLGPDALRADSRGWRS